MAKELTCSLCLYTTSDNSNFKRHAKIHEDVKKPLTCVHCHYSTSYKSNLLRHQRSHENGNYSIHRTCKEYACPMCSHTSPSRNDVIQHYVEKHEIVLKTKNLQFTNMEKFSVWKNQFEKDTHSKFISRKGASTRGSETENLFRCHRDGFFVPRGAGKRHLKQIGSNKINGCCPAGIKVISDSYLSLVNVVVVETHVGHSNDVGRLSLTVEEKEGIAVKLAAGIDVNVILDKIREERISNDLSRIDLVTRRDLLNIAQQFNLTSTVKSEMAAFNEEKKNVEGEMLKTLSFAKNLQDLKIIMNGLAPMIPTMKASREAVVLHPKREINVDKRMSPQKLFSTKNKRKKDDSDSIRNPTAEEQVLETNRLLLLGRK